MFYSEHLTLPLWVLSLAHGQVALNCLMVQQHENLHFFFGKNLHLFIIYVFPLLFVTLVVDATTNLQLQA